MGAFQTQVLVDKSLAHSNVTLKTAPNSISPTDTGGSLENLADLFVSLGWDGDMATLIYTLFNLRIGATGGANSVVETNKVAVKQISTVIAQLLNHTSSGELHLKDGTSAFYTKFLGVPFTGSLTADRTLSPPDESGTIVTHVTKDTIEVANGGGYSTVVGIATVAVQDPSLNVARFINSGTPILSLLDQAVTGFDWKLQMPAGMLNSRTITPLDATGSNPVIVQSGRLTSRTAAVASICAESVPVDRSYRIECNLLIKVAGTNAFKVGVDYTDEGGTARTMAITLNNLSGTPTPTTAFADGAIPYAGMSTQIRAGALSTITVKTFGTFTGCTYNVEAKIIQLSNT